MNLELLTQNVIRIAEKAGKYLLQERGSVTVEEIGVKGQGDFVSRIDHSSEELIRTELLRLLPESVVMAEEDSPDACGDRWRWIVDPLDGTLNYLQGLPIYAVSIALEDRTSTLKSWGEISLGVIHLPSLGLTYDAWRNGGARKNGNAITVRKNNDLKRVVTATGFPFRNRDILDKYLRVFGEIFLKTANIRRIGSAAADLAWVAEGVFDGFWETNLHPWDVAAGEILIEEAGGLITDFWGQPVLETCWVVCGNKLAYQALREVIGTVF